MRLRRSTNYEREEFIKTALLNAFTMEINFNKVTPRKVIADLFNSRLFEFQSRFNEH
jgi:hypothetical protein